jgi:HSP20 family molecular chaperone IbpA
MEQQIQTTPGTEVQGGPERASKRRTFAPRTDIYETKDAIVLVADLPGVDEASLEVTLEKGVLTFTGKVDPGPGTEGLTPTHCEYEVGDFYRAFSLPEEIDRDKIEATVRDGVLRLRLPKARAQTHRIAVRSD